MWASASLLFACAPKPSTTVQQAAQSFGLIGSWATDCGKPTSPDDSRMTFAFRPDGSVSLLFDTGIGIPDGYTLSAGQIVAPDEAHFDRSDGGHIVLQKTSDGRLRFIENVEGSGRVLVQNGMFTAGGAADWSVKCS